MNKKIQSIKDRIEGKASIKNIDDFIVKIHYKFCQEFGWMSFDDFRNIDLGLFFNFIDEMEDEAKRDKDKLSKVGRR